MDKPLHDIAGAVCGEKSFLEFVKALIADRERENVNVQSRQRNGSQVVRMGRMRVGWENTSIDRFLEAAVAWAEDSNFALNQGLSASNSWHRLAEFLYAGKIYE